MFLTWPVRAICQRAQSVTSCSAPEGVTLKSKLVASAILLVSLVAAGQDARLKAPLVRISGSGGISVSGASFGPVSGASVSKHNQTFEMAQQMLKRCPDVTMTLKEQDPVPDYELMLNHEFGESQILLLRGTDKTVLYAIDKPSVGRAVKEGCKAILADWKRGHTSQAASGPWNITKPEATK